MILFSLILASYLIWRAALPLRIPKWGKAAAILLILLIAFKFHILHLFGGPMFFAPELPPSVLLVSAWLYASLFLFFFLVLFLDLATTAARFVPCLRAKASEFLRSGIRNRVLAVLLIVGAALAACGVFNGTRPPAVKKTTLELSRLPQEADGMTIAVLSDIHADATTGEERIRDMVERVNELKPDLIVLLGDLADGRTDARGNELKPLEKLSAKFGVYGIPGNHEYYSGYADWMRFFSSLGIRMLSNSGETLPNGVFLAGVADEAANRMQLEGPDLNPALRGRKAEEPILLLCHRPGFAETAREAGVSLQISGHTHGGMILGFARLVALFNGGFSSGLYQVGDMLLYVSNGAGIWSGFPIRLGHPAEISFLTLKAAR